MIIQNQKTDGNDLNTTCLEDEYLWSVIIYSIQKTPIIFSLNEMLEKKSTWQWNNKNN